MFNIRTIGFTVLGSLLLALASGCTSNGNGNGNGFNVSWPEISVMGPGFSVGVRPPVSQPNAASVPPAHLVP
jgi:hypothetical protein